MIEQYTASVLTVLGRDAIEAAKAHAIAEFPKESCGWITTDGAYVAAVNRHDTPEKAFKIEDPIYDAQFRNGMVRAIVHSHPNGPVYPSEADMAQQIACDLPFVIISLNENGINQTVAWGDALPCAPLLGRPFVHGILDCYSLKRDVFRLGREACLAQGIHWPLPPINLPEVAREDDWWQGDDDLYIKNFKAFGFREITRADVQPGDVFYVALGNSRQNPKKKLNHCGLLLEHNQILHQTVNRLSGRIPAGVWARAADMWVRYEGPTA